MESTEISKIEEGYGSCESGWTMYIASSIHEDPRHIEDPGDFGPNNDIAISSYKYYDNDDGNITDSDASSCPTRPTKMCNEEDMEGSKDVDGSINSCRKTTELEERNERSLSVVKDGDTMPKQPAACSAANHNNDLDQSK